jgi:ankyrin repeat protein
MLLFAFCMIYAVTGLQAMEVDVIPVVFSDIEIANCNAIETLLAQHGSTYAQASDSRGNTPLHRLLEKDYSGNPFIIKESKQRATQLLAHRASLSAQNDEGETPIHRAVQSGSWPVAAPLLHKLNIKEINQKNHKGNTALDLAIVQAYPRDNVVESLVAHGAIGLSPEAHAKLNIHTDAFEGKYALVKLSHIHNPSLLDSTAHTKGSGLRKQMTPLNAATCGLGCTYPIPTGIVKIVAYLLEQRASTTIADSNGNLPLHHAVDSGSTYAHAVLTMLLNHTACYVNAQNNAGNTPLHRAVSGECNSNSADYIKHADLLITHNAELNIRNNTGKTPLHRAVEHHCTEMVTLLLRKCASSTIADNEGNLPLHIAAYGEGQEAHEIVDILIKNNSSTVNACNINGDTSLHRAASAEHLWWNSFEQIERCEQIARSLLFNGATPNLKNVKGKTALDIARELKNENMVKLLGLDMEAFIQQRTYNAKFLKRAASELGLDNAVIEADPKYQRLLDFGAFDDK